MATLSDWMPNGVLALTVDPTVGQRIRHRRHLDGETLFRLLHQLFRHVAAGWHSLQTVRRRRRAVACVCAATAGRSPERRRRSRRQLAHIITALASTLSADELLSLDNETVLHRLYHEEQVRLFDVQHLRFHCSCSRERSGNTLVSLGLEDAQALVAEQGGTVEIDCQFCNERYLFDAADIAQLFAGAGVDTPSDTRH